jgi:hypothetical protein
MVEKMSKNVKKLSNIVKKLLPSCQKVGKKLLKILKQSERKMIMTKAKGKNL